MIQFRCFFERKRPANRPTGDTQVCLDALGMGCGLPDKLEQILRIAKIMVPMREITRWKSAGCLKSGFTVALILGCSCIASAQDPEANSAGKAPVPAVTSLNLMGPPDLKSLPRNLFQDQKSFWLTPFH